MLEIYKMLKSLQSLVNPADDNSKLAVAVHAAMMESGFIPITSGNEEPSLSRDPDGSISLQIASASFLTSQNGVYEFEYLPGPCKLKLVEIGSKMVLHAVIGDDICSVSIARTASPEKMVAQVKSELIPQIHPEHRKERIGSKTIEETSVDIRTPSRPSIPIFPYHDPLRYLPGQTPPGGDQVGPSNPMFGQPRFDPLGPGGLGEPDFDHQLPGPFGQRPNSRPFNRGPFGQF